MNKRQLDVWGIYRDPEHVLDALKIIYEKREEITKPLTVFVNCVSKFTINGEEIERPFDTLVYSEEADIVLMLSGAGGYYDDANELVQAEPRDIFDFFDGKRNGAFPTTKGEKVDLIPYEVVFGQYHELKNDTSIPEIWFAREQEVLEMGLDESLSYNTKNIDLNSDDEIDLSIGYYINDEFREVWGVHGKGLVKTDNNWIVVIDEGYEKNLSTQATQEVVDNYQGKIKR